MWAVVPGLAQRMVAWCLLWNGAAFALVGASSAIGFGAWQGITSAVVGAYAIWAGVCLWRMEIEWNVGRLSTLSATYITGAWVGFNVALLALDIVYEFEWPVAISAEESPAILLGLAFGHALLWLAKREWGDQK